MILYSNIKYYIILQMIEEFIQKRLLIFQSVFFVMVDKVYRYSAVNKQ